MMSIPVIFRETGAGAPTEVQGSARQFAMIPVLLALGAVIALRRRVPEKMLLLAAGAALAQVLGDVSVMPVDFGHLVIIYTVASRNVRWASRLALAGAVAGPNVGVVRSSSQYAGVGEGLIASAFITVPFLLAWVLGDSVRTRRAYYAQLEERATRLEREREAHAQIAAAAERARIARELHDVVAHNVSVMVVQADGAAYVLDGAPEQARQALETISGTGRQALAEMRRLLGVLRSGEDGGYRAPGKGGPDGGRSTADEYVPQPGVEQVAELVDAARGAGMTVHFAVEGTPRPLPSSVELTAYRVVQEALTNSRKHGGPEVTATVRLRYGSAELSLLAEDDGHGGGTGGGTDSGTGAGTSAGTDAGAKAGANGGVNGGADGRTCGGGRGALHEDGGSDGLGHGLIGMRERVGMVGGSLRVGPRPDGGFRICAVLPLKGAG
jgi:signal transduction histidine kinase